MVDDSEKQSPERAFLATASHEIRTPLNGILGTVSLLLETELQPAQREYAESIRQSGTRLLELLNSVLDYARLDAGAVELETESFCPERLAREVVELLAPRAHTKSVDIAVRPSPAPRVYALGDAGRIRQILFNLIGNALKFTDTGGVLVDVAWFDGEVCYSVYDTGPGIKREDHRALFDAFRQTTAADAHKDGGVGLGLAIVSRLTDMLDGHLEVISALGYGTMFQVRLPLSVDETRPPPKEPTYGGQVGLFGLPPATHLAIARGLARAGATPMSLQSPRDALVHPPDALLVSADASSAALRRLVRIAPTIVVLRPEDRGAIARFRKIGCTGWLVRPLRTRSLLERVALAKEGGLDEVPDEASAPVLRKLSGRILIAEDNPINSLIAQRALEKSGFETTVVVTGNEALEATQTMNFVLILMDLRMPVMDGFEAMRQLRQNGVKTPIIAISAEINPEIEQRAMVSGADAVAAKPIDAETLRQLAARWVERPGREVSAQ